MDTGELNMDDELDVHCMYVCMMCVYMCLTLYMLDSDELDRDKLDVIELDLVKLDFF